MECAGPDADHESVAWDAETPKRPGSALRRLCQEVRLCQTSLAFWAGVARNHVVVVDGERSSSRKDAMGPASLRISTLSGCADIRDLDISTLFAEA